MSVPAILVVVALVLAVIEEFNAQGRSLLGWAVILVALSLLWGQLG
jgi:hypothetical protein